MKKIMFVMMAIAALSFASCGNCDKNACANDTTQVSDTTVVDSVGADSVVVDSVKA